MTEEEYLVQLSEVWPDEDEQASPEALRLSAEAVTAHPESADLWALRGQLIEMAPEHSDTPLAEALACYRKAAELDPTLPETWEAIGYYLDSYDNDLDGAEQAFRRAIEAGGEADSYTGLAQVLARKGQKQAAVEALSPPNCPFARDEEVEQMRDEIAEGMWDPE